MTRGFLAAGALLVAALLVAAQIGTRRPAPTPAVKSAAPPIVLGGTTPPHRPARPKRVVERDIARLHPAPAGTARVARRFMVALLQYENDDVNRRSARSVLKSTTTPRLWRMIDGGRRPVSRRGLSSGHLASVLKGRTSGSAASVLATVARRRERSSLALVVVRRGSHWLVDALAR